MALTSLRLRLVWVRSLDSGGVSEENPHTGYRAVMSIHT